MADSRSARPGSHSLSDFEQHDDSLRPVLIRCAVLVAASLLTFASSLPGDFVWLDQAEIAEGGYRIQNADDFRAVWTTALDSYQFRKHGAAAYTSGGYWRPLYALSISLDWLLWRDRPIWYHMENILWHALAAVLLFTLAARLLRVLPFGLDSAFWGTLLFAVHPLGVHSVAWISGRKDVQCTVFAVLAIVGYLNAADAGNSMKRRAWTATAVLSLIFALGFKELACVVPLFISAVEWMGLTERSADNGGRRSRFPLLLTLWIVVTVWFLLRILLLGGFGLNVDYPSDSPFGNLATHSRLWWHYMGLVLWPVPVLLSDRWRISHALAADDLAAIVGVLAIVVGTAAALLRRHWWALFWVWYIVWLLPVSGIVPLRHLRAERYLYPASWGLLMLIASAGAYFSWRMRSVSARYGLHALAGVVALGLALKTVGENRVWRSDVNLFGRAVERDPHYVEGRLALAYQHLNNQDYSTAAHLSELAIQDAKNPDFSGYWSAYIAHTNFGLALYHQQKFAAARREFAKAVRLQPGLSTAHYHAGLAALGLREFEEAERVFARALELDPDDPLAAANLAFARLQRGDAAGCVELLAPLIDRNPNDIVNRRNYASALLLLRRFDLSIPQLGFVLERDPYSHIDRAKLAWALFEVGRVFEARAHLKRAQAAIPDDPTVLYVQELMSE